MALAVAAATTTQKPLGYVVSSEFRKTGFVLAPGQMFMTAIAKNTAPTWSSCSPKYTSRCLLRLEPPHMPASKQIVEERAMSRTKPAIMKYVHCGAELSMKYVHH